MAKKQMIIIMTDSQRWDMVGSYKDTGLKTPNIDDLAKEGVRYDRAYTTSPVCEPARAGIFIGSYAHDCGAWTNSQAIVDNAKSVGRRLRDNGMPNTAYIGKWHLDGGDYFGLGRCPDGWDEDYWYDMRNYLYEHDEAWRVKSRNPKTIKQPGGVPEEDCYAYGVSKRALDYISKKKDEDFFLVVSYDEPHAPFICPEPYASMYDDYEFPKDPSVYDNLEGKPFHQKLWAGKKVNRNPDDVKIIRPDYFGCNSYVDYEIGKVLNAIKENVPDAAVIYTSDHGDFLEGHCLEKKGAAAYDSISRIPLIIKTKDGLKGKTYEHIISHIGITPAVLEYFGIPIPRRLQGKSLLKTAYDLDYKPSEYCFIEYGRQEVDHDTYGGFLPLRAVVSDRYKLVINLMSSDELYDLHADPYETKNLIEDESHAKERDHLHDVLLNFMDETRDPFRGYVWLTRPWRKDAVASWKCSGMTRQRENEEYEPRQLDYVTGLEMIEATRPK